MEVRYRVLLKISWYIGLIALIGGTSIFLIWLAGRYWGALDFDNLEIVGLFWMIAFFWLSLLALVLLAFYVYKNRYNLHRKMLYTLLLLLVNIPTVFFIVWSHSNIQDKVFVKLTNDSKLELSEVRLIGDFETVYIGSLGDRSSKVFNYEPPSYYDTYRERQVTDTLSLVIVYDGVLDTIDFPIIRRGTCKYLEIDDALKVKNSGE